MKTLAALLLPLALHAAETATAVVVPIALKDAANAAALAHFDPEGGAATFTALLSTPPATNVTHVWCSAVFTVTNRAKLNLLTNTAPFAGNVILLDYSIHDPAAPFAWLTTNGLAPYSPPLN